MTDYVDVTELAGDLVSAEQVERLCHRYHWAGEYCRDKDVLEIACGAGTGLGYLAGLAASLRAGDISQAILDRASARHGERIDLQRFDAQNLPFAAGSFDIVILLEALYFVPAPDRFAAECRRVLRSGGKVLIATANPDLYDFRACAHSHRYYGVAGLRNLFEARGFDVRCFGYLRINHASLRQRALRPLKKVADSLNLTPATMARQEALRRFVFGPLLPMPTEVPPGRIPHVAPDPLPINRPNRTHKVIYCTATLS